MKGVTALKAINKEASRLRKKHPGKKYSTLRAEAAKKYRAGKLGASHKPRKKRAKVAGKRKYAVTHQVRKVGKARKKRHTTSRKRHTAKPKTRIVTRTKTVYKVRRIGGSGSKNMVPLLIGAGVVGLGLMLLMKSSSTPTLVTTANPARNAAANQLVQYAQAAGLAATAISALINNLNSQSDAAVISAGAGVSAASTSGGDPIPAGWLA